MYRLTLIGRLTSESKLVADIKYEIGCNNMCGVGMNKYVIILNDRPVIAASLDELIKKMREII